MNANAAVPAGLRDILVQLGDIPIERVRHDPMPGKATFADLAAVNQQGALCELVDGTLVEKVMGWRESLIAVYLIEVLAGFVRRNKLGLVTGPDGFVRILTSLVRGPDVAYFSWRRLPGGGVPAESIPEVVPDLAIEVLSASNTYAEMARKRREYFYAGVQLVWMIDPRERTVAVFTNITDYRVLQEDETLDGADVLPGLQISLTDLFAELDRHEPNGPGN